MLLVSAPLKEKILCPLLLYVRLASILARSQDPEDIAAHLFLMLDWNMVSCAENAFNSNMVCLEFSMMLCLFILNQAKETRRAPSTLIIHGIFTLFPRILQFVLFLHLQSI
jgi:hypothetical protein